MKTFTQTNLVAWLIFLVLILTVIPMAPIRMYWIWAVLGLLGAACVGLSFTRPRWIFALQFTPAVLLLISYVLYWTVIAALIYPNVPASDMTAQRTQDLFYVIVGQAQQGALWGAFRSLYIQLLMPVFELIIAIAFFLQRVRNKPSGSMAQ